MLENKTILITGGSGFIGSHLAKKLLDKGEEVICLDNFFTGTKNNINELLKNSNFELIRHDVTEPIKLEIDNIWHLACPASPIHYQFNPIKTTKTSFMGTYNMLGLAKRVGAKFLLASTSEEEVQKTCRKLDPKCTFEYSLVPPLEEKLATKSKKAYA